METLAWFELTAFSVSVRETPWVFPLILIVHSIGMGLSAGAGLAIGMRAIGLAPRLSLPAMSRFLPLVWWGFAANLLSGAILLAAYPAKALTNPVFYLKLALLAAAIWATQRLTRHTANAGDQSVKLHAALSLSLWAGVIIAGRFLAYTHSVLLASWEI